MRIVLRSVTYCSNKEAKLVLETCYRRKFKFNENYFDEITRTTYILGVIFSTGDAQSM
jgi:hypothetical protein